MTFYTGIGSRKTPTNILLQMAALACEAARLKWYLRSGAASGADRAFEVGADQRCDIYLPWPGFNGSRSQHFYPDADAYNIAAQHHPNWHILTRPARCLMARNVHVVLGGDLRTRSRFVCCWTPDGKEVGGTGHAVRVAKAYGIPVYNLAEPSSCAYQETNTLPPVPDVLTLPIEIAAQCGSFSDAGYSPVINVPLNHVASAVLKLLRSK